MPPARSDPLAPARRLPLWLAAEGMDGVGTSHARAEQAESGDVRLGWRPERATELRPRHGARQMSGYSGLAAAAAINALQHLYLYSAASSQPSIHSLEVLRVRRGASSSNREWRRVRPMAEIKKFAEAEALGSRGNAGNGDGRGGRTPGRKRGEACKDEKTKNNLKWLEKMIW